MGHQHKLSPIEIFVSLGGLALSSALSAVLWAGQGSPSTPTTIKSESNLVELEVIATDRKGHPITDLGQDNFRVFDNEQEVGLTSFSRESTAQGAAPNQERDFILFFDDTNMSPDIEKQTRTHAAQFAQDTTSPNRPMAVVNFGGTLQVRQPFTSDPALARAAVLEGKLAGTRGGLPLSYRGGGRSAAIMQATEGDLDARSVLQALRDVAQSMAFVPGRKSLVLFSPGFVLPSDRMSELTATIDTLNRANIAVYPVDSSGVVTSPNSAESNRPGGEDSSSAHLPANQLLLTAISKGTGGFDIFNTNDFLKELNRVRQDRDEYYTLGYNPVAQVHDGSYRNVKIKVERHGVELRYRTGYFDTKSPDLLLGTPEGKAIEARLDSPAGDAIAISVTAPYFYPEPGVARVDLGVQLPGSEIIFEKKKGDFHSEVEILGIATRPNGSTAARFSDTVKLDYDKLRVKELNEGVFRYSNSFRIAPGNYTVKLAISSGNKFAKYETPFYVQPFIGDRLSLAGPALGEKYIPVNQLAATMDSALSQDRPHDIVNNMQLIPSANYRFAKASQPVAYVEVYDPSLKAGQGSTVSIQYSLVDQKTHKSVFSSPAMPIDRFIHAGNPLVPLAFRLPTAQFEAGEYRVEIRARDAAGNASSLRSADFSIE